MKTRKLYENTSMILAFAIIALFFVIGAIIIYLVGGVDPEVFAIMKWIAFGLLMLAALNVIIMIIFIIKLLEFRSIYKTQKRLRNNETNEFDKQIFGSNNKKE